MDYEKRTVEFQYKTKLVITVTGLWHPDGYFEDFRIYADGDLWDLLDTRQSGGGIADDILDMATEHVRMDKDDR